MKNTTLCYIERDGKYLMLHRVKKKNDANCDKWIGVGGKFEDMESPEDCVVREVLEETGLTLTNYTFRAVITFASTGYECEYMHLFTADGFEGEIKECDEGDLEWIAKDELMKLPMWEGDRIFLEKIAEPCPFFSLKLSYDGDRLTGAWLDGKRIR